MEDILARVVLQKLGLPQKGALARFELQKTGLPREAANPPP